MKINRTTLVALLATSALFVLNPAARAADEATNAHPKSEAAPRDNRPGGPRFSPEQQLERLTKQLSLTDEQKAKVKVVLEEQAKERAAFRDLPPEERRAKARTMREEMGKKLKPILTDEQYKKWEAMPRGQRQGPPGGGEKPADASKD